jgi:hypothetical protein
MAFDFPQVIGSYHLLKHMGGEGILAWEAEHLRTRQQVTFLLLDLPLLDSVTHVRFWRRFERVTAQLLALPAHGALLPLLEAGEYQGFPYLVYPLLAPLHFNGNAHDMLRVIQTLAEVLALVHQHQLVHGTLAQASLLTPATQTSGPVVLAGVGLRALIAGQGILIDEMPPYAQLRTPWGYLKIPSQAPECFLGREHDGASDVYTLGMLGATLCEPSQMSEPDGIGEGYARCMHPLALFSHPLKALFTRLCAYQREERPTMQEVAAVCREMLAYQTQAGVGR